MQPAITIIIATYKRPHLIERALGSVAEQGLRAHEVIVVDDASGDNTADVVAAWSSSHNIPVVFIQQQENGGAGTARNAALRRATGKYVGFLDSDDAYLPHALATLAAPLDAHQDVTVSFADAMQHWADNRPPVPMMRSCLDPDQATSALNPARPEWRRLNDPQSVLLTTSMIPTCAALFRRSAAEAVGLMPEYRHGEDWIFWLKLSGQGSFIGQFTDVALVYRQGDNQTGPTYDARNAQLGLNALLGIRDGRFGISLTEANRMRIDAAIAEKTTHLRYHASRVGLAEYSRMLRSAEAEATGGVRHHLLSDPKSLLRALLPNI